MRLDFPHYCDHCWKYINDMDDWINEGHDWNGCRL